jgi:flagellar biosynthesis protein FlhB
MALRVVQPIPLRTLSITAFVAGVAAIEGTGLAGPLALVGFALLCMGVVLFDAVDRGHLGIRHLGMFLATFMERADEWRLGTAHDAVILQRAVFLEIAKVLGTLMFLLMLAGISASVLQNVPRFVLERIKPKLNRISLKKGWQRLFGGR